MKLMQFSPLVQLGAWRQGRIITMAASMRIYELHKPQLLTDFLVLSQYYKDC